MRAPFRLASLFAAVLLTPGIAAADITNQGQLILSAERMFGFNHGSVKDTSDVDDNDYQKFSHNSFTLLGVSSQGYGPYGYRYVNPHAAPALGVHYNIIPSLSLGALLGFGRFSNSSEVRKGPTTVTTEYDPATLFLFAPRVGYSIALSSPLSLWLRGGVTLYTLSSHDRTLDNNIRNDVDYSQTGFSLDLDPMLLISPVDHFAITVGPTLNLPLAGSQEIESHAGNVTVTVKRDLTYFNFGIVAGLLGYF